MLAAEGIGQRGLVGHDRVVGKLKLGVHCVRHRPPVLMERDGSGSCHRHRRLVAKPMEDVELLGSNLTNQADRKVRIEAPIVGREPPGGLPVEVR